MQLPSQSQVVAFGRHVVSYSMGALTAGVALHIVSGDQAHDATQAITQISTGVGSILAGCTTLIALASAVWAAWKSSPFATLLQASKLLGDSGKIVLKDAALAQKLPDNVVAAPTGNTSGKGNV
jgi:hypothetical protein